MTHHAQKGRTRKGRAHEHEASEPRTLAELGQYTKDGIYSMRGSFAVRIRLAVVAGAPEDKWSQQFNKTVGSGWHGNLNVAMKMVSLGDFTIQGVTFDPSDVARAVSKVTMQTVVLAARIYGVPIKLPTGGSTQTPTDGTALAPNSGRLADIQTAAALHDAKLHDDRSALLTIALAVVREQAKLSGTDTERKAAIDAIKTTYDAHKARLDLSSLQGGVK